MDAWLSCHAFFADIRERGATLYLAGGDCERLRHSQPALKLMVNGVREGFNAVRKLGRPYTPFLSSCSSPCFRVHLPSITGTALLSRRDGEDYVFGRHVRHAAVEDTHACCRMP